MCKLVIDIKSYSFVYFIILVYELLEIKIKNIFFNCICGLVFLLIYIIILKLKIIYEDELFIYIINVKCRCVLYYLNLKDF